MPHDYTDTYEANATEQARYNSDKHHNGPRDERKEIARAALERQREKDEAAEERAAELSEQELVFVEAFVTTCGYDPQKAALEAGWKNKVYGFQVFKRPRVMKAIDERMRFEKMEAPEVVNRVAQMFRADLRHFLKVEEYEEEGVAKHRVVVDLLDAMQNDRTYALKKIEFYRSGEVKSIAIEDRIEAAKLIGAVFGLFGVKQPLDDDRPFDVRARELGHDPKMVIEAMIMIAKQRGYTFPKELIEGQLAHTEMVDAST